MNGNVEELMVGMGERIKAMRKEQNLSQTYVAKQCGFSEHTYSKIERGFGVSKLSSLIRLCGFYGKTIFNEPKTYGQALLVAICEKGIDTSPLADELGVSRDTLIGWIHGDVIPRGRAKEIVEDFLKLDCGFSFNAPLVSDDFHERLREYIAKNKVPVKKLAKQVGVNCEMIYGYMSDLIPARAKVLHEFYKALGGKVVLLDIKERDSIGLRIRKARIMKDMERGDLAKLTGISSKNILHYESGVKKIDSDSLKKIKEVLGELEG